MPAMAPRNDAITPRTFVPAINLLVVIANSRFRYRHLQGHCSCVTAIDAWTMSIGACMTSLQSGVYRPC
jgi:hypothetical protein